MIVIFWPLGLLSSDFYIYQLAFSIYHFVFGSFQWLLVAFGIYHGPNSVLVLGLVPSNDLVLYSTVLSYSCVPNNQYIYRIRFKLSTKTFTQCLCSRFADYTTSPHFPSLTSPQRTKYRPKVAVTNEHRLN